MYSTCTVYTYMYMYICALHVSVVTTDNAVYIIYMYVHTYVHSNNYWCLFSIPCVRTCTCSYLATTLRNSHIEPMPSLYDIKRVVTEHCILPMG